VRETGRPLDDRADLTIADLRHLALDDLRKRYAQAADQLVGRIDLPPFILDTAKVEPVQVTATLELIAEDTVTGNRTRPWPVYLKAARDAFTRTDGGKR